MFGALLFVSEVRPTYVGDRDGVESGLQVCGAGAGRCDVEVVLHTAAMRSELETKIARRRCPVLKQTKGWRRRSSLFSAHFCRIRRKQNKVAAVVTLSTDWRKIRLLFPDLVFVGMWGQMRFLLCTEFLTALPIFVSFHCFVLPLAVFPVVKRE